MKELTEFQMKELTEFQLRDLSMIQNPHTWPNAILPMVKGDMDCAFLVKDNGPNLYMKNMFELETGPLAPQLKDVDVLRFDSFEAIIEAGWKVD